MDHIATKLGQAGYDVGGLYVQPTTTKTHPEKITHIVSKLDLSGLTSTTSLQKTTPHHSDTKWIIIGAIIGGVLLIALAVAAFFFLRRFRQRKAYGSVNPKQKAMEQKDVFNADMDESPAERLQESQLQQRNYESGYDSVDTRYEGSGYDPEQAHGDKRAKYGA
jgi:hypothetical protein